MRVLVAEDDPGLRSVLERGLREHGYVVDAVVDGRDAGLAGGPARRLVDRTGGRGVAARARAGVGRAGPGWPGHRGWTVAAGSAGAARSTRARVGVWGRCRECAAPGTRGSQRSGARLHEAGRRCGTGGWAGPRWPLPLPRMTEAEGRAHEGASHRVHGPTRNASGGAAASAR